MFTSGIIVLIGTLQLRSGFASSPVWSVATVVLAPLVRIYFLLREAFELKGDEFKLMVKRSAIEMCLWLAAPLTILSILFVWYSGSHH